MTADELRAAAQADLRQRLRRLSRELAPQLAMKSRTEIRWIYRAAVTRLCDDMDRDWRARFASTATAAPAGLRDRLSGVPGAKGIRSV